MLSAQPAACHDQVVTALAGALAPYLSALPGTAALAAGAPATLALRLAGALLPGSYQGALTLNLAAATAAGRRAARSPPGALPPSHCESRHAQFLMYSACTRWATSQQQQKA